MEKYRVGVIGGTGMVGQRFVTLLENHPWFQLTAIAASSRSAGKTYEEAIGGRWALDVPMPGEAKDMVVLNAETDIDRIAAQVDFVFSAVDMKKEEIQALEEAYARRGCPVVSNNSAHRWTPDVPMVVPEINPEHLRVIEAQRRRLGTERGFIAVKSNCSLQSYVPALHPLRAFGLEQVLVCTYQAISGAGKTFETWPEMVDNVIPYIGGEEEKSEQEPLKLWGRVEDIEIREGDHPLAFTICGPDEQGRMGPLPCQDLLLFTPLNPEADSPYGVSLLRGLPFLTDILMKIYHTIGINWERCGSLRFAVTCRDGGNGQAEERSRMLAGEWSRAMQDTRSGSVRDFVAVGDVDIQVIGADAPVLDSEVPVRQILEQVVAKTGIPPFMLGLSWSSTERMSSQQADMLTTEITAIRRTITPVVERICRLWLRMHGYTCGFEVLWEDINLQDEVEDARAALYLEQARKLRLENDAAEAAAFHTRREV